MSGEEALGLQMADEYEGEDGGSVKAESDLAPYKPKCDVLVRATARRPAAGRRAPGPWNSS